MTIQLGDDSGLDSSGAVQYLECGTGKTWCWWGPGDSDWKECRAVGSETEQKLSRPPLCHALLFSHCLRIHHHRHTYKDENKDTVKIFLNQEIHHFQLFFLKTFFCLQ